MKSAVTGANITDVNNKKGVDLFFTFLTSSFSEHNVRYKVSEMSILTDPNEIISLHCNKENITFVNHRVKYDTPYTDVVGVSNITHHISVSEQVWCEGSHKFPAKENARQDEPKNNSHIQMVPS